jgi:Uma2 family endonuclease
MIIPNSQLDVQQAVLYDGIDWDTYERILAAFGDRRFRHTYRDGMLEIMSPLNQHEWIKKILGRIIEMAAWRMQIPIRSCGSTTLRKKLKRRGLEPDECYYVANEPVVRARADIDFRRDPPPDLAIEIDVTHRSIDRFEAYAKLGVAEIWRHDTEQLTFYKADGKGSYSAIKKSVAFPFFTAAEVQRYVEMLTLMDENSIMDELVAWLDGLKKSRNR